MAHALLWIESLVAGLLIVCTLSGAIVKASSRLRRPRLWQLLIGPLFAILAVAVPVGLTVFAGVLKFPERMPGVPFYPMVVWASLFLIGTSVLLVRGLRIRPEDRQPCAMSWPLGRLIACSLVAAALTCLTHNSLENDVRIRMMQLRLEAGAKALAMAPARILDRDNAAPIYQEAGAASGQFSKGERLEEIWSNDWRKVDLTNEKVIEFINSSQPVLRLLRRGASMPAARFDWDSSDPMHTPFRSSVSSRGHPCAHTGRNASHSPGGLGRGGGRSERGVCHCQSTRRPPFDCRARGASD